MGMKTFLKKCVETEIDGVIIPDLPFEEFKTQYKDYFNEAGVYNILLISPQTPEERIRKIDKESEGFIYMVSSYATTGGKDEFSVKQKDYFRRIKEMKLGNPCLVGFGVSNNTTYISACEFAQGAIIGSAFIRALDQNKSLDEKVAGFMSDIRGTKDFS